MRIFKHALLVALFALSLSALAIAGDTETAKNSEALESDTAKAEETTEFKNQTHCPVMGGKIDSTVFTDIQGQRVYHCCPGCSEKLVADPDTYFKKAAAEGVRFENIQTVCPVSGKELQDKLVAVDYEGRHIAFCCEGCPPKFEKDPQTYLKKLDEVAAKAAAAEGVEDESNQGHEGHNH